MGYTHQFTCQPGSRQYAAIWPQTVADTGRILEAIGRRGITVCGPDGAGAPIVDDAVGILFGGDAAAGHHVGALRLPAPGLVQAGAPADCRLWLHVKTGHEPYDLAVTTVLLRCHVLEPETFQIGSDGSWEQEWIEPPGFNPRDIVGDLFGVWVERDPLTDPTEGMAVGPAGWIDPRLVENPVIP